MQNSHLKGLTVGVVGIMMLSPDALLIRLINSDAATVIAGRAFFMSTTVLLLIAFVPAMRSGFRWTPILSYGFVFGVGVICFPLSIQNTYTANTLGIIATAPIIAAVGSRIFLKESVPPQTWWAAIGLFAGVAVILSGGGGDKNGGDSTLLGNGLALVTAFLLAAGSIIIRRHPQTATYPGLVVGCLLAIFCMLPFAEWQGLDARNIALLALNGNIVIGLSFSLIVLASRLLPPAEVNLLFLLEAVLGPAWVWAVLGEEPPASTLAAGAFIIFILMAHSAWALKR